MSDTLQPLWTMWAASNVEVLVLATINFCTFATVSAVIACRARVPKSQIQRARRFALLVGLAASATAAISPLLWQERPGPGAIAAGLAWLIYLLTRKD